METISVALICTVLSVIISYCTFRKNNKKDLETETTERIEMKIKLDYISKGVDDIKLNNQIRDDNSKKIEQRLIIVEEEIKTLFKYVEKNNVKDGEK